MPSILYVEDEKIAQVPLAKVIRNYCDTLYLADNGEEGLELFKAHSPSIVVTDIKMPIKNGIEMAKEIKAINPEIRIIFTTAFSDFEYLEAAIDLLADGYILKPISVEKFETKLSKVIGDVINREELEEKERMLIQQSKLASMGEMISNIAHQWRLE